MDAGAEMSGGMTEARRHSESAVVVVHGSAEAHVLLADGAEQPRKCMVVLQPGLIVRAPEKFRALTLIPIEPIAALDAGNELTSQERKELGQCQARLDFVSFGNPRAFGVWVNEVIAHQRPLER